MPLQVCQDPGENEIRLLENFIAQQLQRRVNDPTLQVSNYGEASSGLLGLIRDGRFKKGGIGIWFDEKNEIQACSGFYPFKNLLICGVRTLVNFQKVSGLGLHAERILPAQVEFGMQNNFDAAVLTFNRHNYRILDWIEANKHQSSRMKVLKEFEASGREITFNKVPQKILVRKLKKATSLGEIEEALDGQVV